MHAHRIATITAFALAAHASTAAAQPRDASDDHARFSGGRLVAEILAGAVVGSAVAYGTYESLCDGHDCLGAGLAGFGANFAVTPLAVWGVGRWMGGDGTLGMTYLGASTALAPFSAPGSPDESPSDTIDRINVEFAISTLLLPVTSSLFFELSSHVRWKEAHPDAAFAIAPVRDRHGATTGAIAELSFSF
ncbi:MAG TPA: hypothetical protein VL463_00390 [Kofleriaceae bacterium]|jgi:hypothetical protein|nr:hypothetical protein [Kofleriaceae bacterium]